MAQQTTNYKLQKYEATDRPDLTVQYNASMDIIDVRLKEAGDKAWSASDKVDKNTAILNGLGATDASTAGQNKVKWDKASSDATAALQKVNSIPTPESLPAGLKAFCTALGLTNNNASALGAKLERLLNRTAATENGAYTVKNLAETKITADGLPFVPATTGRAGEEEERGE